jgi:DNA polymerase delta subunit 1
MSPIKRTLIDRYGEDALICPKRLRGGGGGPDMEDDPDHHHRHGIDADEDLFDLELIAPSSFGTTSDNNVEEYIPPEVLDEVKKKIPVKDQQRWKRPDLPESLDNTKDIHFQWIDMDVTTATQPLARNPNASRGTEVIGSPTGPVPILRCYGVDEDGHSVATYIHGFTPYAYFALPHNPHHHGDTSSSSATIPLNDSALAEIRTILDSRLREMSSRLVNASSSETPTILVLGVTHITDHQSIFGYETPHTQFLKIYVALPTLIPPLKRLMEDGIALPPISSNHVETYTPFECNVPFVLRFMVDRNVSGAGWFTLPASTYTIRSDTTRKETHCQVKKIYMNLTCFTRTHQERELSFHVTYRLHFSFSSFFLHFNLLPRYFRLR